jgi:hypothetical protein
MADIRNKRLNGNAPENPLPASRRDRFDFCQRANTAIGRRKTIISAAATYANVLRCTVP